MSSRVYPVGADPWKLSAAADANTRGDERQPNRKWTSRMLQRGWWRCTRWHETC